MKRMTTYIVIVILAFAAIFYLSGGLDATDNRQSQWDENNG